jgi:flagellar basal body-associated protein FliL
MKLALMILLTVVLGVLAFPVVAQHFWDLLSNRNKRAQGRNQESDS